MLTSVHFHQHTVYIMLRYTNLIGFNSSSVSPIVSPCWSQSTMNTIGHRATLAIEQHEHHNCHQAPRTPRTGQAVSDSTISANQVQKPWDVGHRTARTPCWPQHWPHNSTNTTLATEHYQHHEKDRQRLLRFPPTSAESWNVG